MHAPEALDVLTARVNELTRVCALLGRENAELRSQVSALSAMAVPTANSRADYTVGDVDDTTHEPRSGTWDFGLAERAARPLISRRAAVGVALAGAAAGIAGVTVMTERSGQAGMPAAPAGVPAGQADAPASAPAELTGVEEGAAETAPTATGSVVNATLSTVSAVLAGTNTNAGAGVAGANTGTGPGVRATSSHGRGGIFAGGAAQIQLTPAGSTHPKSGQRGDLYADNAGRLWYCKKSGASATWHQIA